MKRITCLLACMFIGSANAVIIDFQSLEHNDANNIDHGFQYIEDGFQIDELSANQGLHTFGTLEARYTGSTALFNDTVNGTTELTRFGGGIFNLVSIDLAELNGNAIAGVTFTANGGHTQTFTLDGNAFGAETFIFDPEFLGVNSVTWVQQSPFHQFDNIIVNTTSVPEPVSIALFGLSLAGVGFVRKRKTA